jgi:hypothetical protein
VARIDDVSALDQQIGRRLRRRLCRDAGPGKNERCGNEQEAAKRPLSQ